MPQSNPAMHEDIGARGMLRRMREIMAARSSAQERLNQLAIAIASSLIADICSIYLRRRSGALELCATFGLAQSAVHQTRLEPGEGLVGHVLDTARPINLERAGDHPAFALKEETGEDPDASFLAVPILRGGSPIGVLTIQTLSAKIYTDDDLEALQTAAMVLAEVVADSSIQDGQFEGVEVRPQRPERLLGQRVAEGIVIGQAFCMTPQIRPTRLLSESPLAEVKRLEEGITALHARLDEVLSARAARLGDQPREVLEAYQMIAKDPLWINRLMEAARSGLTAEAAVDRVRKEYRARFLRSTNAYLRERLHDLEDLANRLLRHLDTNVDETGPLSNGTNTVLFTRTLGPAELLDWADQGIRAVVMEEGGANTHAAIVAKAAGIALVARIEGVLDRVETGDHVIVDGVRGEVHLRPSADVTENYQQRLELREQAAAEFVALRDKPAISRDGVGVELLLNAGLLVDLPQIRASGADGIGLFRTEFQFLIAEQMPRIRQQAALYESALIEANDRPVTFRTLDLGGDKILQYARAEREENPALGWRGARMAIDRPRLARYQLRGLITAARNRHLRLMFPGITTVAEFVGLKDILMLEWERAERRGHAMPSALSVGAMVETPAIALDMHALLDVADFVSVGANDLAQHVFAADRNNARVNERYDPLLPVFLRLLADIHQAAEAAGKPASVCGEIAGRPLDAMVLVALGYRHLSMAASQIGPVKRMIRSLDIGAARTALDEALAARENVRAAMKAFARSHGVRLNASASR